jgi:hypothetical protein
MNSRLFVAWRFLNCAILVFIALIVFIVPGLTVLREVRDPNIRSPAIPRFAWTLHRALTPKYERWANKRLESEQAAKLSTSNISGTEWPLFGSVFYLWATESLQDAWDKDQQLSPVAPKKYAHGAIVAATRLVIDPNHAHWVKVHWGDKYLTNHNVFYRMLLMAALTSHARLTEDRQYLPSLGQLVENFATELDASPHGLLEDYPSECYPGDVLAAIAVIRRADHVLGTDHSAFIQRAIRGFEGKALDPRGLVPYAADARLGEPLGPTRGCGNSYASLTAPEVWPEQARKWYELYTKHFWQHKFGLAGFREFPSDMQGYNWYADVDAGPVINGYGFASCAFGIGAARANGHFEHAYPLTAEMYAASMPLPNGTLLLPRLLSNATDAPYLGEASILYVLTRMPAADVTVTTGGSLPGLAIFLVALQFVLAVVIVTAAIWSLRRSRKPELIIVNPHLQFAIWLCLLFLACLLVISGKPLFGVIAVLAALLFPRSRPQKPLPAEPMLAGSSIAKSE